MVRKIAIAAAKVLQAAAVVAVTVTIEDATREVMVPKTSAITATAAAKFLTAPAEGDGCQDFGKYGDNGCEAGEVTAVVGSSDDPGRDKGSDVALEAITAVLVVTIVADAAAIRSARFYRGQDFGDYGDSGGDVSYGNGGGRSAAADVFFGDRGDRGDSDNPGRDEDVSVPKNWTNNGDYGGGVSYANDRGGCKDCGNYGDSGGEVSYGDGDGRGGRDGAQNCGNYGNSGGKDSGGNRGGRGNSDNLRRDEGVDADWKAITTVVVVAIVTDVALIMSTRCDATEHCGNYGDGGGNISYGDGDGRDGMGDLGRNEGDNAYYKEVIVLKTVAITAIVFTAIAVVAVVAAAAIGLKTVANNGYSGGEVFYADYGCRGVPYGDGGGRDGIANPGRHKDGDFALETITEAVVVTIVADDFIQDRTSVITATAAATFLAAMEVVAAVAMTPDLTRNVIVPKIVAITATVDAKVLTTTAMVSATAIILDATRMAISRNRGGRGNSDNSRRDEGINADWKAITTVVVVAMVADAALTMSAQVVVLKTVVITAKVFTAIAVVAAVAITQDTMRAAKSPKRR
ncbi:hypothetical protein Bbelb_276770 [Branchiostoma belcheri]|nr:hypothetical protein Bbelb_276770 [Branchiostoma belcheri]